MHIMHKSIITLLGGPLCGSLYTARDPELGLWQRIWHEPHIQAHYCESPSWSERLGYRVATPVHMPPPQPKPDLTPA